MSIQVQVPVALARYADNQDTFELDGNSVDEALSALTEKFPGLKAHLFGDDGKLRHFVNVYVNDEDIRYGDNTKTTLKNGDIVTIVPSIAGGCA